VTGAVPALPVRDTTAAVACYTGRFGFTCVHRDDGFAVVVRDDVELHLWEAGDDGWRLRPEEDLRAAPVRSGAESFLAGTASCRIEVTDVEGRYAELAAAGVLHPVDTGSPVDTDFGTREFPTLDVDGNLLTFFRRR
jgi:catechol 2,3-dioxygenase-like lactoylglutathione lyase family enzyme